jgi:signal transduction histidine kinase
MLAFAIRLYKNEKFKDLENLSTLFAQNMTDDFMENHEINGIRNGVNYTSLISNYNFTPYVYNEDGTCIFSPDGNTSPLSEELKKSITDSGYIDFDSYKISSQEPSILYGQHFSVRCEEHDQDWNFYLVTYSSTYGINEFDYKMILSAAAVLLVCILSSIVVLKQFMNRHHQRTDDLCRIVEKYSKGDYSETLEFSESDPMQKLSQQINSIAENAKAADETSKTFISNVSHELRTPMTTIGGFVDGILDGTIPKSNQNEYLVLVSKEIKRLTTVIRSMLNMARFESGTMKPNFKEANVNEIVIQTVLMFEKRIENKNVEIEGLDSETIIAEIDVDLIQQVIYNLVENAIKFVNEGGKIIFNFTKEEDFFIIGIRNTGEGLKEEEMLQIFDRFYKTDSSRSKDVTGLGLGLAISQKIVQFHKGEIMVKSIYGEYTEFAIQLPFHQGNRKE